MWAIWVNLNQVARFAEHYVKDALEIKQPGEYGGIGHGKQPIDPYFNLVLGPSQAPTPV